MDTAEALVRGFFVGFITAQFISGWVSGPLIVLVLIFYVFGGNGWKRITNAAASKAPAFVMTYFTPVNNMIPTTTNPPQDQVDPLFI